MDSEQYGAATRKLTRRGFVGGAAALGGAAVMAPLLAGCGGGSSSGGSSGKIDFLTSENDAATIKVFKAMFSDYEKSHPKIQVTGEFLTADAANQRLIQLIGAGRPPDIVKASPANVAPLALNGLLEPVTDMMDQVGQVTKSSRLIIDGEDYLIPTDTGFWEFFYRKDLLDKAGVEPPKTWDDYKDVMARLGHSSSKSNYPTLQVTNAKGSYTGTEFVNYAWSNEVQMWKWDGKKWNVTVDEPANMRTTEEVLDLMKYRARYSPATANYVWADVNQAYASGKIAMIDYAGARTLLYLRQQAPEVERNTGVIPMPYNKKLVGRRTASGFVIARKKGGVDRQIVKEFALGMLKSKHYLDYLWSVPGHLIPPARDLFEGKWRTNTFIKQRPDLLTTLDELWDKTYTLAEPPGSSNAPKPNLASGDALVANVYSKLVADVLTGGVQPKEAIQSMAAEMRKTLQQQKQ